ncbi:hypothetical protein BHE74_00030869 [Ensete ventricosum]|nr:hypothetical protein BHE74_00030869 [Ensete ventricosum]
MPLSSSSAAAAAPAFDVLRARPLSAHDRLRPRPRCGGGRRSFSPVLAVAADAPSCLYVGPIESASKEMLEALYQQARDSYYNGKPLIVDAMFDKIEVQSSGCLSFMSIFTIFCLAFVFSITVEVAAVWFKICC